MRIAIDRDMARLKNWPLRGLKRHSVVLGHSVHSMGLEIEYIQREQKIIAFLAKDCAAHERAHVRRGDRAAHREIYTLLSRSRRGPHCAIIEVTLRGKRGLRAARPAEAVAAVVQRVRQRARCFVRPRCHRTPAFATPWLLGPGKKPTMTWTRSRRGPRRACAEPGERAPKAWQKRPNLRVDSRGAANSTTSERRSWKERERQIYY